MQHEITTASNLLDENNNLIEPGYSKKMLSIYNKKTDFITRLKTKEWDYYCISNNDFALCLTIADNGYMGLDSISFVDFQQKTFITKSPMQFFTLGKKNLPSTSLKGDVSYGNKKYNISFINEGNKRILSGYMNNFSDKKTINFSIELSNIPEESMVIATPFEKAGHFYYNQKLNCMAASGIVSIGDDEYIFNKKDSAAVLDWGRGIWTYENTWYWSSLSTYVDGIPFGFNLGYGFGDTSKATENMLFYQGKAHKLDQVDFGLPTKDGKDDYYGIWNFTSNDNRLSLRFEPIIDRAVCTDVYILKSDQHQVFGRFYGDCILDDGKIITLTGQIGFAEKVSNKY